MNETDVIEGWEAAALKDDAQGAIHPTGHMSGQAYAASGKRVVNTLLALAAEHNLAEGPLTFLDYGCGDGRVTVPLQRVEYADAYDPSPTMRDRASRRGVKDLHAVEASLAGNYSVVFASCVLIHHTVKDAREILQRMVDLTAPGGLIVFDVHVRDIGRERKNWTDVTVWTKEQFNILPDVLGVEIVETNQWGGKLSFANDLLAQQVLRKPR